MIYLHLGAHKTATTYLQNLLSLNRGIIARSGRVYWRLEEIRPVIEYGVYAMKARESTRLGFLKSKTSRQSHPFGILRDRIDINAHSIISEENILGHVADGLIRNFYSRAQERLHYVSAQIGNRETEIWLSLRAYPTFLSSVYAEALRHGYDATISQFLGRSQSPGGRWLTLISTIHEIFPESKIVIWCYEDFKALRPQIVERLSGVPLGELRPLTEEDVRPSPSGKCVEAQSERVHHMQWAERITSMAMLEEQYPLSKFPEKFNPWTKAQFAEMLAAYEKDLDAIRVLDYVEFLVA